MRLCIGDVSFSQRLTAHVVVSQVLPTITRMPHGEKNNMASFFVGKCAFIQREREQDSVIVSDHMALEHVAKTNHCVQVVVPTSGCCYFVVCASVQTINIVCNIVV